MSRASACRMLTPVSFLAALLAASNRARQGRIFAGRTGRPVAVWPTVLDNSSDVRLRNAAEGDLPIFFEQQCDSDALRIAAFVPRDREAFMAHWTKLLAEQTVPVRTVKLWEAPVSSR
jgi:hypothetical protein